MPGMIMFRRRWSAGSDDLVVPGVLLSSLHILWTIIVCIILAGADLKDKNFCVNLLWQEIIAYLIILIVSLLIEILLCIVSMRGSILYTEPRNSMPYILYARLGVMLIELCWLGLAVSWLVKSFETCPKVDLGKKLLLGLVCSSTIVMLLILATIWCAYDSAGRSWLKMKIYQRSRKDNEQTSRFQYKRSTSNRNWRQRKVLRAYQNSWDSRCKFLFCCVPRSDRVRHNFGDIARLLSEFFRDLDVVPSDVIAGLVLLRKFQKLERDSIVRQRINGTYDFLSGVPINPQTKFLSLDNKSDFEKFQEVIHYMHFAQGAYGWPMFLMTNSVTGLCQLCSAMRCSCMPCVSGDYKSSPNIIKDNCCECNYAALKRMLAHGEIEVTYATYHVDVGETPFFIAVNYSKRKIVISIRGTLSMKDIITDLNAESEPLPLNPPKEDWLGHKGMVQAAQYILNELEQDQLLEKAFELNPARGTRDFGLVIVGHSLGAGTAAILAILLQEKYEHLTCYSYSPPGGLLSMPAVEHSKNFVTSVVVGKDVVPRIGLHQMEALRADLINAIKRSVDPKWKTIACATMCCCCTSCASQPTSVSRMRSDDNTIDDYKLEKVSARSNSAHPNDSSIALTLHRPLYPPGRIIHIVRNHSGVINNTRNSLNNSRETTFRALWCDNKDFDEVLISPVMVQDHMPDQVLLALNKVVMQYALSNYSVLGKGVKDKCKTNLGSNRLLLETSFTSLNSPCQVQEWPLTFYSQKTKHNMNGEFHKRYNDNKLAPLASPETLSLNSDSTIEKVSMETPHVVQRSLRRTPIIRGNLSKCADDEINVFNYAKYIMDDNLRNSGHKLYVQSDCSNYESAFSLDKDNCCTKIEFESAKSSLEILLVHNQNGFKRNESLPLLNDLADKSQCQKSPKIIKKKNLIYPIHKDNLELQSASLSSESSV